MDCRGEEMSERESEGSSETLRKCLERTTKRTMQRRMMMPQVGESVDNGMMFCEEEEVLSRLEMT